MEEKGKIFLAPNLKEQKLTRLFRFEPNFRLLLPGVLLAGVVFFGVARAMVVVLGSGWIGVAGGGRGDPGADPASEFFSLFSSSFSRSSLFFGFHSGFEGS